MKVISWNICATNGNYPRLLEHLMEEDADIICLQEVTHDALGILKKSRYHIYPEIFTEGRTKERNVYKVILSRDAMTLKRRFVTKDREARTPWAVAMGIFLRAKRLHHTGMYADIGNIRIFNLHLDASVSPKTRLAEFSRISGYLSKKRHNIVCGDFNSYGVWYFNFVPLLLMNMPLREYFINEKYELDKHFSDADLRNIFEGMKTVNFIQVFRMQSDYILISKNTEVLNTKLDNDTFGSDHNLILADIRV
jgi:endonuclease/exonuclease/phosphatase family metal-dependent hydrolase